MSTSKQFHEGQRVDVMDGGSRKGTVAQAGGFPFVKVEFDDGRGYGKQTGRVAVVESWRVAPIDEDQMG